MVYPRKTLGIGPIFNYSQTQNY